MNHQTCEWRFVEQHLDQSRDPAVLRALARMDALEEICQRALDALTTEQDALMELRNDVELFADDQDEMEDAPSTTDLRTAVNYSETDAPEASELQREFDNV
jgi:hypothetical protein